MYDEEAISAESVMNYSPIAEGVSVLVVDGDSACLSILSRMLYKLGYKVLTAKKASDALSIAQEKEGELDLVLTEVYLPDMNKYELLEKMKAVSKLPVVIMSDEDDEKAMLGGLFKGAVYYILKPVTMDGLKNLWQFAFTSNRDVVIDIEEESSVHGESQQENTLNEGLEIESFMQKEQQSHETVKRKNPEWEDKDEERSYTGSTSLKRSKLIWTNELHKRFLQAVRMLGVESAHPKKILQHMNVPGLRKENISSHLQKYRQSLKKEQEAIQRVMIRYPNEPSFPSYHSSPTSNFQGGFSQFPNLYSTSTAYQPEFRNHFQNFGSAYPSHVDSSFNEASSYEYGQQSISNKLDYTYHNSNHIGSGITSNMELGGLGQMESFNGEGIFDENNFSGVDDYGHKDLTDCPLLLNNSIQQEEQQQQQQRFQPQGEEQLQEEQQQFPTHVVLSPPSHEQEEHDTFGAEGQLQPHGLLSPPLQIPSPPPPPAYEQEEHDIFGVDDYGRKDLTDCPILLNDSIQQEEQQQQRFQPHGEEQLQEEQQQFQPHVVLSPSHEQEEHDTFGAEGQLQPHGLLSPPLQMPSPAYEQEEHDIVGAEDQYQPKNLLSPPLQMPPAQPVEQEGHDTSGSERGETEELFDIGKGSIQLCHDEFDDFW